MPKPLKGECYCDLVQFLLTLVLHFVASWRQLPFMKYSKWFAPSLSGTVLSWPFLGPPARTRTGEPLLKLGNLWTPLAVLHYTKRAFAAITLYPRQVISNGINNFLSCHLVTGSAALWSLGMSFVNKRSDKGKALVLHRILARCLS